MTATEIQRTTRPQGKETAAAKNQQANQFPHPLGPKTIGPVKPKESSSMAPRNEPFSDVGGGEWRNGKRFISEVCEQVRYACPGVVPGVRIGAEKHMEGGLTREEMINVAQDLQALGADYINLSDGGGYDEGGHLIIDGDRAEHGSHAGARPALVEEGDTDHGEMLEALPRPGPAVTHPTETVDE